MDRYGGLYKVVGKSDSKEYGPDCAIEAALDVVAFLRELKDKKFSVDSVIDKMFQGREIPLEQSLSLRPLARQFIFTIIGACSMIYCPIQPENHETQSLQVFRLVRHDLELPSSLAVNVCQRPMSALFREFAIIRDTKADAGSSAIALRSSPDANDVLTSSDISISALTASCRIEVEWVDYADAHLLFDPKRRTLYLFRFPSYFAAAYYSGDESLLAKYVCGHLI
jgi:hypothetical protein